MNSKLLGVILIIIGIALCVWGYDVYDIAGAAFERAFSGDTPIEAWLGLIGGAILIVFGVFKLK
ncbi:MAG: uncharacterized membrane protein YidH (DUF202 family) [Glaciecola sp.]|jgi:uncharacterized membrane protein YidH (DUF202 family)